MLRYKVVREEVTRCSAVQQTVIARLQSKMEHYKGLQDMIDRRHGACNSDSSDQRRRPRRPKRNGKRNEKRVSVLCRRVHEKSVWTLTVWLCYFLKSAPARLGNSVKISTF